MDLQLSAAVGAPVELIRRPGLRTMRLRVHSASRSVKVQMPPTVSREQVVRFVLDNEGWIRARLKAMPDEARIAPGRTVPLLGVPHVIVQDMSGRRPVCIEDRDGGKAIVVGRTEFPGKRVLEFLNAEARRVLRRKSDAAAAALGRRVRGVTVRDTTSLWGSCSSSGEITYCWRLLLAPEAILDYVVAHECAHLVELNHSPAFWKLCASLSPIAPQAARSWLKRNGPALHAWTAS